MSTRTINYGIDLGTTNSVIAHFEHGRCLVFRNHRDEELTPSVVQMDEAGDLTVGRKAYEELVRDSKNTVGGFKRWMGTQQIKEFISAGRKMSAEELSAEVLKELKIAARENRNEDISAAVITVPASFESLQCDATQRAAKMAGIDHAPLLQEPIAAAIAYGLLENMKKGNWLVYDFGGGTFDVALVSFREGRLSVIDHSGDNYLGGTNLDDRIVDSIVIPTLKKQFNLNNLSPANTAKYGTLLARARGEAERAKIELSRRDEAILELRSLDEPIKDDSGREISAKIPIRRGEYESLISKYVTKSIDFCQELLARQRISKDGIEKIVLVGGPTRTPLFRKMISEILGIPLEYSINPMAVVAQGAAIYAGSQFLPERLVSRTEGMVQLQLEYDPCTTVSEPVVGGFIKDFHSLRDKRGNIGLQLRREGGDWQSARLNISDDGKFATYVHLNEGKTNIFYVTLYDEKGNAVGVEPSSFQIVHGFSVAEPPLPLSIGVELEDGSFSEHIKKGEPIPARGRFEYRTTRAIKTGDESEVLNIKLYEGEHDQANNNRYIGVIKITGKDVQRNIAENAKIEILIKVDEQRHVSVTAEVAGEKIQRILKDERGETDVRLSPKVEIQYLEGEIELQKERLNAMKADQVGSSDGQDAKQQVLVLEQHWREADLERDVEAAKGGDQAACEKVDRQVKDIRAALDGAEYLYKWPSAVKEFQSAAASCKWAIGCYGKDEDKDQFATMKEEAESVLAQKDRKRLEKLTEGFWSLYWSICMRQDEWWIAQFKNLQKGEFAFRDPERAKVIINDGQLALQRNDVESLESITRELWALISQEERREASKELVESGLRR